MLTEFAARAAPYDEGENRVQRLNEERERIERDVDDILDRAVAANGQNIGLKRITGTGANQVPFSVTVRAWVTNYVPQQLGDEIIQGDTKIVISPTAIEATDWPGAQPPGSVGDSRVPRRGDKVTVQGRDRNIEAAAPFYIDGALVRIELQTRGQQ